MSQRLISLSPDLTQLREAGYDIAIKAGHLVLRQVPYVDSNRSVRFGALVSTLNLAGDVTAQPETHTVFFCGDYPCDRNGSPLTAIQHQEVRQAFVPGLEANYSFSSKPINGYADYFEKMTTYYRIISSPALSIDPDVLANVVPVVEPDDDDDDVFVYLDNAAGQAGITTANDRLKLNSIAIVGLGGSGSYVLDLVSKTPVREIHLFDADELLQHNAFRSPGAPSIDVLRTRRSKVTYFAELYSAMRRGIIAHEVYLTHDNLDLLADVAFVFLCIDRGAAKQKIIAKLLERGTPFIDVGMGVELIDDALIGALRITTGTPTKHDHLEKRVTYDDAQENKDYETNIQVADLNALNATLAVLKWKKVYGFYHDFVKEHNTVYMIETNALIGDDPG